MILGRTEELKGTPDLNQMITLSVITLSSFHRIALTYLDNFRLTVMLLTKTITHSHCKDNYFNYLRQF